LADSIAIVTGALGAIGTSICQSLAKAGCRIAALDHPAVGSKAADWQQARNAEGAEVTVTLVDLTDHAGTRAAIETVGAADILVNAAGITRDSRFAKMTPAQWREVLAANLDSAFNCAHAVFEGMCARGHGRIVNISSVNGQKGQFGQANYSASKAGLHGLTMALAQEGARCNVTVNTVSPGYVATPMTAAIKPEALQKICAQIPVGRMGTPAEIARVVAFLCAEDSAYITGANIPVNGGLFMSA
jgi:acetoacetyl-CoA reductase